LALLVERCVGFVQVPSQPAVGSRLGQSGVADVDDRTGQEVLRWSAEPSQHEQRVLARGRASLVQPGDRSSAKRVILSPLRVELRRLLPQFVGEFVPAQFAVAALGIECGEERIAVEDRQGLHVRELTPGTVQLLVGERCAAHVDVFEAHSDQVLVAKSRRLLAHRNRPGNVREFSRQYPGLFQEPDL
jgi:hypothetical protein